MFSKITTYPNYYKYFWQVFQNNYLSQRTRSDYRWKGKDSYKEHTILFQPHCLSYGNAHVLSFKILYFS